MLGITNRLILNAHTEPIEIFENRFKKVHWNRGDHFVSSPVICLSNFSCYRKYQ